MLVSKGNQMIKVLTFGWSALLRCRLYISDTVNCQYVVNNEHTLC